jgi:hypothetical protein
MPTNDLTSQLDNTVKVFDKFYSADVTVNATEFDVVYSYFKSVCQSENTAKNFTAILFRISAYTGEPIMTLLEFVQGKRGLQLNATMAYYLNSLKSKTTLYGVANLPIPNQNIQRNIVI